MVTGVVLAGGQSRRFGSPKAFATYRGKPFYTYALSCLQQITDNDLIVSHPSFKNNFPNDVRVIEDFPPFQGKGPLAGIYSAMAYEASDWYIVLPCDMPFVQVRTLEMLVHEAEKSNHQAIVPVIAKRIQPLVSIYHYSCMTTIARNLQSDQYAMHAFLDKINVTYLDENRLEAQSFEFQNINSQDDYAFCIAKEGM